MKREDFLQPFSREHHHNLLLCWKIRTGISKGVEFSRIKKYCDWFFEVYVQPHFKLEEKYLFPVLGENHAFIKKALAEHRRLTRLFKDKKNLKKSVSLIEEELASHVRFEERVVFQEIQKQANEEQLKIIAENHVDEKFEENTADEFWK